jgi:competence protein ComEA
MLSTRILHLALILCLFFVLFFASFSLRATPLTRTPTAAIDLNRASVQQLVRLPGIGPKRAEEIIHRRSKRAFQHPRELLRMKGIGAKTYRRLAPWIFVQPTRRTKPSVEAPTPP